MVQKTIRTCNDLSGFMVPKELLTFQIFQIKKPCGTEDQVGVADALRCLVKFEITETK